MCARSMPARLREQRQQPADGVGGQAGVGDRQGLAGPGLLAYIVTSKFSDYLPLTGWKTSSRGRDSRFRGPRSRCGAGMWPIWSSPCTSGWPSEVRASHVVATDDTVMPMLSNGKTANARMWVYVGDDGASLQRLRLHPEPRPRRTEVFSEGLPAGAAGRRLRRLQRRRGGQRHHARRLLVACATQSDRGGENRSRDRARGGELVRALFAVERQRKDASVEERLALRQAQSAPLLAELREKLLAGKSNCCPSIPWRRR